MSLTVGPDGQLYEWCVNLLVVTVCKHPTDPLPPIPGPDIPEIPIPETGPDLPGLDLPDDATGPTTGADVEADITARVKEETCKENCDDCRPAQDGQAEWVAYSNVDKSPSMSRVEAANYQAFVSGFPHDPAGRRIIEWYWSGTPHWDGIIAASCTLLEAKHGYDEGYFEEGWNGGDIIPLGWVIGAGIFTGMVAQCAAQIGRMSSAQPPANLLWVFSRQRPMIYFMTLANASAVSNYRTEYRPFV